MEVVVVELAELFGGEGFCTVPEAVVALFIAVEEQDTVAVASGEVGVVQCHDDGGALLIDALAQGFHDAHLMFEIEMGDGFIEKVEARGLG